MYNNNMGGQGWGRPMQPQMTGYPQQQQQQGSGFMQPQQTGYPGMSQFQRPMQPQMTGFPQQQQQGLTPQQTGMMGGMGGMGMQSGMQNQVRPQATSNYLSPGPTGMGMGMGMGGGLQPQATGYMGGLQPQQTGFMGGGGLQMQQTGLMPQMTGMPIRDPRMQLMSAQFLPASQPFSGAPVAGNMNFSQASMQPSNFQSQIQNLSQQQQGSKEPRIPWALSKEERKSYDAIFRAWDAKGTGFINGEVAREVFGQSGLETEKLMQIWHLADTSNRGKLNINEFHVAMGLIYRALNGNDIPDTLPPELIPPSAKDLNDSVDFLKDLLKKDTNVRHSTGLNIPEAGSNSGASYAKARSFHENPVAPKKDATAYRHDDADVPSYKSSSRHLDRKTVRYEGQSATDDLSEMKRQLENTQKMLEKQGADDDEDRELERELDDLRYRIRRVQDDIEYYNRRGGRDSADLRRKAERELMHLMHERLPQLEKRLEAKEARQRERKLGESRERDRRNDPYNRYGGSDDRDRYRDDSRGNSRSGSTLGDGEYLRGTFDRDSDKRSSSRDRYDDRNSYRRRDDDRDRDGDQSSPTSASTPPPPPVEAAKPAASPAPSTPVASSGPPKNMSAEERAAWIRAEAQRRVQERMRMLGAVAPAGPTSVDTSVEERLKAEQAEAAAKAAQADQEAAAREEARRARLEENRLQTEKASLATVKKEIKEAEKSDNPPPAPVVQAAKEEIDDQEDMICRREDVLAKEKAEREARLRKLEEQEEEARKQEEAFKERQDKFNSSGKAASSALPAPSRKSAAPPPPPPSRSRAAPPAPAAPAASSASLAPPAPEAPISPGQPSPTPSASSSTNPFHRMQQGSTGAAAVTSPPAAPAAPAVSTPGGSTNPFFRSQQPAAASNLPPAARATPPVSAQPTGTPTSSASRGVLTAPKHDDDDWEESDKDKDEDEADGPGSSTRATRQNLAQALFSNLIPSGRSTPPTASPISPAGAGAPPAPPAPPAAPGAPPAPAAPKAPIAPVVKPAAGPVDRGALLGQIQGGLRLKKTQTNDRSTAMVTGSVIGDPSPPVQTYVPPPSPPAAPEAPSLSSAVAERAVEDGADGSAPPPPPPAPPAPSMPGGFDDSFAGNHPNRQSVDWANNLANDQATTKAAAFVPDEPSVREEAEEDSEDEHEGPEDLDAPKHVNGHGSSVSDEVEGFDLTCTVRVRTLYGYAGQRDEDLTFEENDILSAHPPKDASSDWWYGSLISGSMKGFFPRSYVEPIDKPAKAKALYDYASASAEEATFSEGDELLVVDSEDANWWRVDVGGHKILVAPATYLELSAATREQPISSQEGKGGEALTASHRHNDSDNGSGVMVRVQSQDSAPRSAADTKGKGDWVMVDEDARSAGSSAVNVHLPSSSAVEADAAVDEEAQLAAALEASQKEQRERDVARMREDREMQKAIEASKLEAVAYALGSIDVGAGAKASAPADEVDEEADDSEDTDSTTGWTSSDEDDEDQDEVVADEDMAPHTEAEIRQQTIERLRVLEAAGVLVKTDDAAADPSANAKSSQQGAERSDTIGSTDSTKPARRPPPPPGQKRHKNLDELIMLSRSRTVKRPPKPEEPLRRKPSQKPRKKPSREPPAVPTEAPPPVPSTKQEAPEDRMEDAYDRYLKLTKEVSLQPILPATASGAAAKDALVAPLSPAPLSPTTPARPGSAAGDSGSRTSRFLSTIKSMSDRNAKGGSNPARPDSGVAGRIVSGPIALGSINASGGLLPPASVSESGASSWESGEEPAAARAGATSWSSLVGPEVLSGLTDMERKRQEAIFELISTETSHVRDLQIIVEVFFNSMQSMLSEKASTVIFANIESVLFTAVTYLSDLEARQKEDRLFVSRIGDVLERHMPAMSVYLPYCVNQQSASDILEAERKRDTRVDIHLLNLRTNHPAARGLDLSHFLLEPMQRLTRYPLLLGQILRYTPEDHVDHASVQAAKEIAEGILAKTNEAIRDNEDATALSKLSENLWLGEEAKLDLTKPFVDPSQPDVKRHRRVLRDEMVSKAKSGRKLRLVLTTDLLLVLHAQDSSLYRMPIPVNEVQAQEGKAKAMSTKHAEAFNIVHKMPSVAGAMSQSDSLKLRAATPRNAQAWIRAINAARADAPKAKA